MENWSTVKAGSDHYFLKWCPSVPHFSKQNKMNAKTMFATGGTMGLAEWIFDDTCLELPNFLKSVTTTCSISKLSILFSHYSYCTMFILSFAIFFLTLFFISFSVFSNYPSGHSGNVGPAINTARNLQLVHDHLHVFPEERSQLEGEKETHKKAKWTKRGKIEKKTD